MLDTEELDRRSFGRLSEKSTNQWPPAILMLCDQASAPTKEIQIASVGIYFKMIREKMQINTVEQRGKHVCVSFSFLL